jgi:hypothetical protein
VEQKKFLNRFIGCNINYLKNLCMFYFSVKKVCSRQFRAVNNGLMIIPGSVCSATFNELNFQGNFREGEIFKTLFRNAPLLPSAVTVFCRKLTKVRNFPDVPLLFPRTDIINYLEHDGCYG